MKAATLAGILTGSLGALLPVPANSAMFQHGFSVGLNSDYDSNPTLSATAPESIWRFSASPSYTLSRNTGPDTLNARLGLAIERSSNERLSADRQDPTLSLAWTRELTTGSFGVSASYAEASTRVTEFQNNGLVTADGNKITQSLSLNWSRSLDERRTLSLSAGQTGVSYQGGTLTDYSTLSTSATLSDTWNERIAPYLRFSASHYVPDSGSTNSGSTNSDSFDLMAGVNLTRTDRLSLDMSAGFNQTVAQTDQSGWQGSFKLNYALDDRSAVSFDLSRSVASSGIGGFTESDQLNAHWNTALSDQQNIGADLSWRKSQSAGTGDSRQISLWGSRSLNDLWSLRVQYLYKQSEGNGLADATGSVLTLSLSYAHPDFLDL
jgi:hypothetical protein